MDGEAQTRAPARRRGGRHRAPRSTSMPLWQELPLLAAVALGLAILVRTFLIQAYFIPSGSMEYTLLVGDRVLVDKVVYDLRAPQRGEVVVFRGTDSWAPESAGSAPKGLASQVAAEADDLIGLGRPGEKDFIKRVIGVPGDTVVCCDAQGRVTVNGYPLDEPYVTDNSPLDQSPGAGPVANQCGSRQFGPVTVAPGMLFVMGDHRAISSDSRCQGQVPIKNVIGKAIVVLWPKAHWTTLGVPGAFRHVPPAGAPAVGQPVADTSPTTSAAPAPSPSSSPTPSPHASQSKSPAPRTPSPSPAGVVLPLALVGVLPRSTRSTRYAGFAT